ncbi:Cloroperoxidase [Rhizoclosmatium globosum]|uniref:Cloroperoxidase n=1 Tax=Rhizoclosmatium globosum TaxID=329046 RepID=A0A1Y2CG26_9FUNG|nr:Cloroperoxidase [Rhizoclosmatium globosum]|eukprot:ORY45886.1 Cloroperoxidase [Rhizoclosmatium globosum]
MSDTTFTGYGTNPGHFEAPKEGDLRSPCPALNALSNMGYLPRDGRNITKEMMSKAVQHLFGASDKMADGLIDGAYSLDTIHDGIGVRSEHQVTQDGKEFIDLSDLNKHNRIEHDSSLSRNDAHFGDAVAVQPELVKVLLSQAADGKYLHMGELLKYRKKRYSECKAKNPEFFYSLKKHFLVTGETCFMLLLMGDGYKVPVDVIETLFLEERIPESYKKPVHPVGPVAFAAKAAEINLRALFA